MTAKKVIREYICGDGGGGVIVVIIVACKIEID